MHPTLFETLATNLIWSLWKIIQGIKTQDNHFQSIVFKANSVQAIKV